MSPESPAEAWGSAAQQLGRRSSGTVKADTAESRQFGSPRLIS